MNGLSCILIYFRIESHVILEGDAKNVICEMTEKHNIDVIVMGSRGLGRVKK